MRVDCRTWILRAAACLAVIAPVSAGIPAPPVEQWRYVFRDHDPAYPLANTNPIVVQLTDDDGNGVIDRRDSADVVFLASNRGSGWSDMKLVAVHGTDAGPILGFVDRFGGMGGGSYAAGALAGADVSGDGAAELFVATYDRFWIYDSAGTMLAELPWPHDPTREGHALNLADLNQDGVVEVYDMASVLSIDGSWRWRMPPPDGSGDSCAHSVAIDIDPDSPGLELFLWRTLFASDGSTLWHDPDLPRSALAVADLDADGSPELVLFGGDTLHVRSPAGVPLGAPFTLPGRQRTCAAPISADLDGDGRDEIVLPALCKKSSSASGG